MVMSIIMNIVTSASCFTECRRAFMIVFKPKHETISAENQDGSFGQTINPFYTRKIRVKRKHHVTFFEIVHFRVFSNLGGGGVREFV